MSVKTVALDPSTCPFSIVFLTRQDVITEVASQVGFVVGQCLDSCSMYFGFVCWASVTQSDLGLYVVLSLT